MFSHRFRVTGLRLAGRPVIGARVLKASETIRIFYCGR